MIYDNAGIANALKTSRKKARVSQEAMAAELEVARKTIQNWENGVSAPDLKQTLEWFRVLDTSPLPYLFQYVFPSMDNIGPETKEDELRKSLALILDDLPMEGVRQLLYLFYGNHGSSPRAVMQMITAHLQTPMKDRISHGVLIKKNYEMNKKLGKLKQPQHIQPDLPLYERAIEAAEESLATGRDYVL